MNTKPGKFYVIQEKNNWFTVSALLIDALSIVWNMNGDFRIIPKPVVQNAIDLITMQRECTTDKRNPPLVTIHWDQGITISNQAGRALLGE